MHTPSLAAFSSRLLADYDRHDPCALFAERAPAELTLDEAYAVQRDVARLRIARGERPLGYKVGCIGAHIQQQFGLNEPVCARVWTHETHPAGVALSHAAFCVPAVEAEIAVRLRKTIQAELSDDELGNAIETWFPVIELHNYVFRGGRPTSAELIAGGALHAGIVAREATRRPFADITAAELSLEIAGSTVERALPTDLPGGPLGSLRWLARKLASFGETLGPGDVVLTGSPGKLHRVAVSDRVVVRCADEEIATTFTS